MIKNIIFDFGGVLLDLRPDRCIEQFEAIGYTQIREMLGLAHHQGVLGQIEEGGVSVDQLCDAIREEIHAAHPDATLPTNRQIVAAFCSMADTIPAYRLDFVKELKDQGYRVDALSNTNTIHWGYCQRFFVECGYVPTELFGHVWLSCEMGLSKPDPRIFEAVLLESGYNPEETLFVDDNARNCEVAASLGIRTFCPKIRTDWREELLTIIAK